MVVILTHVRTARVALYPQEGTAVVDHRYVGGQRPPPARLPHSDPVHGRVAAVLGERVLQGVCLLTAYHSQ